MKLKHTALALGAILIPAAVIAGGIYGHEHREHRLERMTEHLKLTEQQQDQIRDIFAEQHKKREALREETRDKVQSVLTEEQQAVMAEHRGKGGCRHGGRHGDGEHHEGHGHHHGEHGEHHGRHHDH